MLEYLVMLLVYFAAFAVTGAFFIALVAMIASMFVLRATRPKPDDEPPRGF
ncbi:MAG: hypothetical protein V3V35_05670 [Dehalococcoidia bacterium]